ncbi:perA [Symbiodinium sp. KB8]|nr:perA [Symbiodinium sp. KB8]
MADLSSQAFPVNTPKFWGNEKELVAKCIETGWISSEGPAVKDFESKLAARCQRRHGIACANGTAALDIAVQALGLGQGDEVILPTFCIISCINQIVRGGSKPVLVDSDDSFNMNVSQVAAKLTPKTKAILCVHTYHFPVDMEPIMALAKEKGLKVIEDAAEMIGQTCAGKPCGSFGDISTMSFYPNKHITTGEGGMVLCDDPELADRCRKLRNLCFDPKKRRFVHEELGWNYRMTNLQAALGLGQLEFLDSAVLRKREIGQLYSALLKGCPGLVLPPDVNHKNEKNIYWVYGVELEAAVAADAEEVMRRLADAKVGTRPFFWPMHEQPVFLQKGMFEGLTFPVAERIARRGFYIPSGLALTDAEVKEVARRVRVVMEGLSSPS